METLEKTNEQNGNGNTLQNNSKDKDGNILSFFVKKGFLLDKDIASFFSQFENMYLLEEILNRIHALSKTRIINKSTLSNNYEEIRPLILQLERENKFAVDEFFEGVVSGEVGVEKVVASDVDGGVFRPEFRVLSSDVTADKKLEVKDFIRHFKDRYNFFKDIFIEKENLNNLVSIDKVASVGDFSIIGIVASKKITKNKNILIELEDVTGRIPVLVNQNKEGLFEKTKEILVDDVLAVKGSFAKDMLFAGDIFYSDSSLPVKKKLDKEIYALFISDIHLGSKYFLEDSFVKFIDWLNCKNVSDEQKNQIEKIKYLFITGDNVDGVGAFPGQEGELKIKDIREQYNVLAGYLDRIPKHITIIMCPGQHDAV